MHGQHLALLLLISASLTLLPLPLSGQRPDGATPEQRIEAGTSLADAKNILAAAGALPGGGRAFAAHPNGDQWLFYTLREDKVDLVIQFSPSTQEVTNLTLYYVADRRSKTSDVAVAASVIQFYSDRSYAVLFPPPQQNSPQPQPEDGNNGNQPPLQK